jgi:hypothetical protein
MTAKCQLTDEHNTPATTQKNAPNHINQIGDRGLKIGDTRSHFPLVAGAISRRLVADLQNLSDQAW